MHCFFQTSENHSSDWSKHSGGDHLKKGRREAQVDRESDRKWPILYSINEQTVNPRPGYRSGLVMWNKKDCKTHVHTGLVKLRSEFLFFFVHIFKI